MILQIRSNFHIPEYHDVKPATYLLCATLAFLSAPPAEADPLTTAFSYQGELRSSGVAANGLHDLRFRLYDAELEGAQVGAALCANDVGVSDGRFTVSLDFGSQFAGQQRWLEIDVRQDGGLGCANSAGFVTLGPRQPLTAAPHAAFALDAEKLNGQPVSYFKNASNLTTGSLDAARMPSGGPWPLSSGLNIDADTFVIDPTNNRIGIGTSTPLYPMHIEGNGNRVLHAVNPGSTSASWGVVGQNDGSAGGSGLLGIATATSGITNGVQGQADSSAGVGVVGFATATTGIGTGVRGLSNGTSGYGVYGSALSNTGSTFGGYFASQSPSGIGVYGVSTPSNGVTTGVYGRSNSPDGQAVRGMADAGSGNNHYGGWFETQSIEGGGVLGWAKPTIGECYGGWFQTNSTDGFGAVGWASAESGQAVGVFARSFSTSGYGVYALASAATGNTFGVYGDNASTSGIAVRGRATATTGENYAGFFASGSTTGTGVYGVVNATSGINYGGRFENNSTTGRGVLGETLATTGINFGGRFHNNSTSGRGVLGVAFAETGTTYGVWGQSDSSGASAYGVFASGRLGASGTKSFRIDHPGDPENKYLLHYSTESPEVLNAYSGTITLDAAGQAIVEMPQYFARINKDPRYTLTAVGAPMPNLHVAEELDPAALDAGAKAEPGRPAPVCRFRIAGGAPGAKVSWEVKAVRNDRWVREHGAPVEIAKEGVEKGMYQHPNLYSQPPEKGMDFDARDTSRASSDSVRHSLDSVRNFPDVLPAREVPAALDPPAFVNPDDAADANTPER